jgi:hypothetical protein
MLFAEEVASGLSFSQAYREAYDCQHSKASTIRTDASRLARMPKITEAIEKRRRVIQFPLEAATIATIQTLRSQALHTRYAGERRKALNGLSRLLRTM